MKENKNTCHWISKLWATHYLYSIAIFNISFQKAQLKSSNNVQNARVGLVYLKRVIWSVKAPLYRQLVMDGSFGH